VTVVAREVMTQEVRTVGPEMQLADLERTFLEDRVSGFPVVDKGRLVGLISRSDVVRKLCVERTLAENLSDFYSDAGSFAGDPPESIEGIAGRVGARLETLRVRDFMVRELLVVEPDTPVVEIAKQLLERHIHRLPVVEGGQLVGIVSALDLVRLVAEGRAQLD